MVAAASGLRLRRLRQRKVKRGAFVWAAFRPGSATVAINDATDVCQSDASSFKLLCPMEPLKHAPEFICVLLIETDSIVANEHAGLALDRARPDLNASRIATASVFQSIAQKIDDCLPEQESVSMDGWQGANLPLDISA